MQKRTSWINPADRRRKGYLAGLFQLIWPRELLTALAKQPDSDLLGVQRLLSPPPLREGCSAPLKIRPSKLCSPKMSTLVATCENDQVSCSLILWVSAIQSNPISLDSSVHLSCCFHWSPDCIFILPGFGCMVFFNPTHLWGFLIVLRGPPPPRHPGSGAGFGEV